MPGSLELSIYALAFAVRELSEHAPLAVFPENLNEAFVARARADLEDSSSQFLDFSWGNREGSPSRR